MEKMFPLISSSARGPLGIAHLPRLWLKILLYAAGRLPEGYRHGEGGFDELLCVRLGIDRDAMVAYIESEKPDYSTLERWVTEHATNLTPLAIATFNGRVRNDNMAEATATERRTRFGIDDERIANAVFLNELDDWAGAHSVITAAAAQAPASPH